MRRYEKPAIAAFILLVVVIGWIVMSSSQEDQRYDSSAFDLRGAASMAARAAGARVGESRQPTASLTLIARTAAEAAPTARAQPAPARDRGNESPAVAPDGGPATPEASPAEAASHGLTLDALKSGAFKFAWRITDHPRVLKFLLNNKAFNDAVFSQKFAQKICGDPGFAQSYMMDTSAKGGVQDQMWAVTELLKKPASAKAAAESQFADRIMGCRSFQAISHDKQAVVGIASANPQTLMVLSDPTAVDLIGGNAKAQEAMLAIQAGLNSP